MNTSDDRATILDARAAALARVVDELLAQDAEDIEVATFTLSGERYALETRFIREIVQFADFTPVPGGPAFLFGVVNLRGEILAVFDLRVLFGLEQRAISDLFRVIVLGEERAEFGVLADAVESVRMLAGRDLSEPPGEDGLRRYLRGVTPDALAVLDGGELLNDSRFAVDERR